MSGNIQYDVLNTKSGVEDGGLEYWRYLTEWDDGNFPKFSRTLLKNISKFYVPS